MKLCGAVLSKIIIIMNTGTIKQIVGPVVDVYFEKNIPEVEHALIVEWVGEHGEKRKITLEVAQHLGLGRSTRHRS